MIIQQVPSPVTTTNICGLPARNLESWKQRLLTSKPHVLISSQPNYHSKSWSAALMHLDFQWGISVRGCYFVFIMYYLDAYVMQALS